MRQGVFDTTCMVYSAAFFHWPLYLSLILVICRILLAGKRFGGGSRRCFFDSTGSRVLSRGHENGRYTHWFHGRATADGLCVVALFLIPK